ncbi:ComEA family DNA-binding protein [Georgenia sp. 311]|uniref:ComEA family DNA-binding protein n=1 Tax=Georgenia sp. 311 TaxID=2585134 RepID=UPI0011120439|nr:ComEA family DNA-binding protein [Georgenia sp. 311]TNC16663.1 ComEA family DNA-binding protein [Georgenia sp. 311]
MRATRRAGPDSAARLRALTRRAYTATAGHLDLEEAGREFDRIVHPPADAGGHRGPPRRRWAVSGRAVLVVLLTVALLTGVVLARSVVRGPSDALPVPQLTATAPAGDPTPPVATPPTTGPPDAAPAPAPTVGAPATPAPVVVHVAGAVVEAGLRTLPAGARVGDAVTAAGGALPDAELAAVNLARPLLDGEQVYVPRVGEAPPGAPDATGGPPGPAGTAEGVAPAEAVVDLNTADLAALDTLPGVGPAIAQRILDWRGANGSFHSVDELLEVPGIGPATLERLRPKVRV